VVDCLGEVTLAALMVAACWKCTVGKQVVHLLDSLEEQARLASSLPGP
jgi:hypothetical protein